MMDVAFGPKRMKKVSKRKTSNHIDIIIDFRINIVQCKDIMKLRTRE